MILGLELTDFWGTVNAFRDQLDRTSRPITKPGAKLISITAGDLFIKGNYQDFQRYPEVDLAMAADAEATLPSLIEAVKRLTTADRKRAFEDRGRKLAAARQRRSSARAPRPTYAWDASPISTARLSAELWAQIKNEDWSLVSPVDFVSRWPLRLWNFDKHYQYIGGSGGAGIGYGAPAVGRRGAGQQEARPAVGQHPERRRSDVRARRAVDRGASPDSAADRDAQQPRLSPGSDARAAHGQPAQSRHHARRHRHDDREPEHRFRQDRRSMGVHAEGPITDPKDLGPAIARRSRS